MTIVLNSVSSQRVAARLAVEKFDLRPPVDIYSIVSSVAQVVEDPDLPRGCDAITRRPRADRSSYVVHLRPDVYEPRLLFTLAHEYAHISLPWHLEVFCHIDESLSGFYRPMETEANEFASEILAPQRWLRAVVDASDAEPGSVLQALGETGMSFEAKLIALKRYWPKGLVVVSARGTEIVRIDGDMPYNIRPIVGDSMATASRLRESSHQHGSMRITPAVLSHWFQLEAARSLPDARGATGTELLDEILGDLSLRADERLFLQRSLSSVTGQASTISGTVEERYAYVSVRTNRTEYDAVRVHPKFETYLARRAREMHERYESRKQN